jgi:hypothetical protein
MKRISSKSRECAQAIGDREEFTTHGALKATRHMMGPNHVGQLKGADLDAYRADQDSITYIVWSYETPIAWVTDDSRVHKVAQKFSMTTSHHQGKLYLLS